MFVENKLMNIVGSLYINNKFFKNTQINTPLV